MASTRTGCATKGATVHDLLNERIARLPAELQVLCVGAAGKIHAYMVKPSDRHLNLVDGEEEGEPKAIADKRAARSETVKAGDTAKS